MIIIEVMGGLGNQLQQYALYRKMRTLGKEGKLDISWFEDEKRQESVLASRKLELCYFSDLPMEVCSRQEKEKLLGRDNLLGKLERRLGKLLGQENTRHFWETGMYHPEIFSFEEMYLTGFWACEKYYADILPQLRETIRFPQPMDTPGTGNAPQGVNISDKEKENDGIERENSLHQEERQNIQNNINIHDNINNSDNCNNIYKKENSIDFKENICENNIYKRNKQIINEMEQEMSVSIHVRRGDYLDPQNAAMFGGICTDAYYEAAVRYVLERCPDAHFYVFSDDSAYVREKYRDSRYTVVDWNRGENSFYDMQLMSCCKHNICANSTFSFWGARLNPNPDKIMIRPAKHKNSQPADIGLMRQLWPGWVIVEG